MAKIKWVILFLLFALLVYTRFVNLPWGLPYPFHPDERNIAMAVSEISFRKIYSPNFWSYGGFQINLGHAIVLVLKFFDGDLDTPIGFQEAVISLRLISAIASVLTVLFAYQILRKVFEVKNKILLLLPFVFSPALIQFAHFGTTESVLMLFYTWLVYESLLFIKNKITLKHFVVISSIVSGLAVATKVSSIIFVSLPIIALLYSAKSYKKRILDWTRIIIITLLGTTFVGIVFSPHYLFYWQNFLGSLFYERSLVTSQLPIFYTRQFFETVPIVFQFKNIFPYALGLPVFVFFAIGFLILPFNKTYNFLRFAFLLYFLPNAFLFTKWTRFMAPAMPLMILMANLTILQVAKLTHDRIINWKYFVFYVLIVICIIPGIAFLSIYTNPDIRLTASSWINKNIPNDSYILSETANVVDLPVDGKSFQQNIQFDFYNLDQDPKLQTELKNHLDSADYVFIPSRRVFANHSKKRYPLVDKYYNDLFSGKSGFKRAMEFSSYPRIVLFGRTLVEFPDEQAEETWSVFDHPVIRIYKKTL